MSNSKYNRIEALSVLQTIGRQLLPLIRRGQFEGLGWTESRGRIVASGDEAIQEALSQFQQLSHDPNQWLENPGVRRAAAITYEEFGLLLSLLEAYRHARIKRLHELGEPI